MWHLSEAPSHPPRWLDVIEKGLKGRNSGADAMNMLNEILARLEAEILRTCDDQLSI